jgi:hypothetical protein
MNGVIAATSFRDASAEEWEIAFSMYAAHPYAEAAP